MNVLDVAKDLVERSRLGDQNAVAILILVGKEAANGVLKAQVAKTAVENYIKAHPAASIGADAPKPVPPNVLQDAWKAESPAALVTCLLVLANCDAGSNAGSTLLCKKMLISVEHLHVLSEVFKSEPLKKVFMYGVKFPNAQMAVALPPSGVYAYLVGQMVGRAVRIQWAIKGSLTPLCPMVGWELE